MEDASRRRQISLTILVIAAVIVGLVLAIVWRTSGALDGAVEFLSRWFFAVFCTLYALAQLRVCVVRCRREARLASGIPLSAFAFFTALWFVLAAAAIVYGLQGGDGWMETAAWVTIVGVICVQLVVLGRFAQRASTE